MALEIGEQQHRIRRDSAVPLRHASDLLSAKKLKHRLTIPYGNSTACFCYNKPRLFRIGEGAVRMREIPGWIEINGQRGGLLNFVEYVPDILIDNTEFFESMDLHAQATSDLAAVLCDGWEYVSTDVSDHGPILEFRTAWMAPSFARGGVWATLAERVIEKVFPKHALLVMKAFPLEYEGRAPVGTPAHGGLVSRQAAMKRYYMRLFGVRPFPGEAGEEGWLWRVNPQLKNVIPPPNDWRKG